MKDLGALPNGNHLFRNKNTAGGYGYYSDEIGGGVLVWDTCLVDESTLLAALVAEHARKIKESHAKRQRESRSRLSGQTNRPKR
jgi:hypothetical protein